MKKCTFAVLAIGLLSCSDDSTPSSTNNATTQSNNATTQSNNQSNNVTTQSNNATTQSNNQTTTNGTNNTTVPPSPCGEEVPEANSACSNDGLTCEYGEDPRENCRTRAVCTSSNWEVTVPRCEAIPDATCPATLEAAAGELCNPQDAWCTYDGLDCECTNCIEFPVGGCQGDPVWKCEVPNTEEGCPTAKPLLGEACAENQKSCEYKCGEDGVRLCQNNVWTSAEGGPCPISTAKLKTDIAYLDASNLNQLSDELQSLKVASWKYTSTALGEGVRYGIIVEDSPESSAVDINKQMVDLYGLTSLLIADAQVKDREIKALRAELEKLKKRR